ncbi:glycerophosphodiester phosphodiesterase family protein [Thiococcus pfennigii]|uniref:glycerophosphodiester phosphodiesterase family protein n=1 Tax=Thiococcus pfennigii TaxID=1057 RepID=UPI0019079657|nr:glycerophosphodiester phosphodiesterase family protein [Thiococcus pfennigii]MBK1730677.1 glycerophosphodiester phosphodiesterase [Thiococcus pfennigii]
MFGTKRSLAASILIVLATSFVQTADAGLLSETDDPLAVHPHAAGAAAGIQANGPLGSRVQLGPRPFFLVDKMTDGALKDELEACSASRAIYVRTPFSIGHRGAAMQFPEHTRESYLAAARMGAGILECDVTFTQDRELVCRHSQCDLATTTDIVATDLNARCTQPFEPAEFDEAGNRTKAASAICCTSDITLEEFRRLRGKMDASNPDARTPEEYLGGTADWRTDLYAGPTSGTLMTHAESIALFKSLGVKMTPELKTPSVAMPFDGDYTQEAFARQMIDEYKKAGVPPRDVYPQSFSIDDVLYWVRETPLYGRRAVFLDDANTVDELPSLSELMGYKAQGINIVAPPTFALLAADGDEIVPSQYALDAKAVGLDIITWTLERSGILADGDNGFYYQTFDSAVTDEGDLMRVLDVLAQDIGVLGVFADWPATVTFYANCKGL